MSSPLNDLPESFCVAPWVSLHLNAEGKRGLCCAAETAPADLHQITAEEFSQSNYMRDIRQKMLNGIWPDECSSCKNCKPRSLSYQQSLNTRFKQEIPRILEDRRSNLEFLDILFLDYRSPICNLKCKTCGPESSSSWSQFLKNSKSVRHLYKKAHLVEVVQNQKNSLYPEILQLAKNSHNLRELYFAGGEPLLAAEHFLVLEELVKLGKSKNITLLYNSNLMLPQRTIERSINLWEKFGEVVIFASVDGVGEVGEYIRTGFKSDIFLKNFLLLKKLDSTSPTRVCFDITATSLLFSQIEVMADFLLKYRLQYQIRWMFGGDWMSKFMRIEFLKKSERLKRIQTFRNYYSSLSETDKIFLSRYLEFFELTLDLPEFSANEYSVALDQLEENLKEFDPPPYGSLPLRESVQPC